LGRRALHVPGGGALRPAPVGARPHDGRADELLDLLAVGLGVVPAPVHRLVDAVEGDGGDETGLVGVAADAVAQGHPPVVAGAEHRVGQDAAAAEADHLGGRLDPAAGLGQGLAQLVGGLELDRQVAELLWQPAEQGEQTEMATSEHLGQPGHGPGRRLDVLVEPGLERAWRDAGPAGAGVDAQANLVERLADFVGPALAALPALGTELLAGLALGQRSALHGAPHRRLTVPAILLQSGAVTKMSGADPDCDCQMKILSSNN
jgi:hypothetical protein